MTDAAELAAMLPEDPTGDAPWQRAARGVLTENTRLRTALHAEHLAHDPTFVAECEEIDRQLADGTFDPGPGLDIDALRERYSCRCDEAGTLMCPVHNTQLQDPA